ncbi:hypothetical protein cypCar_00003454 [Cyprinus carpio]|nr:hypothetical protein cypCar_00003454 [Cyprinus carpio]
MEAVLAKYENQINAFSEFLEDLPDVDEPVWILGARYDLKTRGTGPSSDAGWGCMLRCGQMILAQALVCRHLGRDWRWDPEKRQPKEYHRILHCFLDKKDSCYSIHQMAQMGVGEGKSVGEWYGPNTVAQECFKMPQSCGVLGGKPNLAYYFIGFIDDELIYLDPHTTQQAVDTESGSAVDDQSYHCQRTPHRMKITSLDPSVALGFFCKSEEDFDSWCDLVQQELLKKRNLRMFELVEKHPSHWPPFVPPTKPEVQTTGAEFIESPDKLFESEEEFEILNV